MRLVITLIIALVLSVAAGCRSATQERAEETEPASTRPNASRAKGDAASRPGEPTNMDAAKALSGAVITTAGGRDTRFDSVTSLINADQMRAQANALDRKIIRNAEIIIEIDDPAAAQRKAASIAEARGGYVVSSDYKQGAGQSGPRVSVTVVLRVPASEFTSAVEAVQSLGGKIISNKATGQDVTEEYVDIEARVRSKRALEAQFLEIMKQARKVSDALDVQNQLADVRTDIERLEGRKRYLENQSSLSTITLTLQTEPPLIATTSSGFWHGLRQSFAEGLDDAAGFIAGLIHLLIVLIPITAFIFLPGYLVIRYLIRRLRSTPKAQPLTGSEQA